jgi:hypothetical protein
MISHFRADRGGALPPSPSVIDDDGSGRCSGSYVQVRMRSGTRRACAAFVDEAHARPAICHANANVRNCATFSSFSFLPFFSFSFSFRSARVRRGLNFAIRTLRIARRSVTNEWLDSAGAPYRTWLKQLPAKRLESRASYERPLIRVRKAVAISAYNISMM